LRIADFGLRIEKHRSDNCELLISDWGLKKSGNPQSAIRNPQYHYTPFVPRVKDGCEKASLWPGNA